jgi:hypothetical protein
VLGAQIEQSLRSLRTEAIGLYYRRDRHDPSGPLDLLRGDLRDPIVADRPRST